MITYYIQIIALHGRLIFVPTIIKIFQQLISTVIKIKGCYYEV